MSGSTTPARRPRIRHVTIVRTIVLLLVSGFVLALLVRSVGINRFFAELRAADLTFVGLACACYAAELAIRIIRWLLLFGRQRRGPAVAAWMVGAGANELGPSGTGEIVRGVFAYERFGIPLARVLAPTAVERLFDIILLLVLSSFAIGVLVVPVPILAVVVPLLIAAIGLGLVLFPSLLDRFAARLLPRPGIVGRVGRFLHGMSADFAELARRWAVLAGAFFLSVLVWGLEGLTQWYMLQALGVETSLGIVVSFTALSFLVGFVSFLPGGLGSREAALSGLLAARGAAAAAATTATVALRTGQTLVVLLLAAAASLFALRESNNRPAPDAVAPVAPSES